MTATALRNTRQPLCFRVHEKGEWELLKRIKGRGKPYLLLKNGRLVGRFWTAEEAAGRMK